MSAAEGQLFADYVTEYTEKIRMLGPLDPELAGDALGAVERALGAPRLRWLTGMEIQITDRGNVYGQKLDEASYEAMLKRTAEEEFQKALIMGALEREGPLSLRRIALETGLPLHAASQRLNDLEKAHAAELLDYEDRTPRFSLQR